MVSVLIFGIIVDDFKGTDLRLLYVGWAMMCDFSNF